MRLIFFIDLSKLFCFVSHRFQSSNHEKLGFTEEEYPEAQYMMALQNEFPPSSSALPLC